VSNTTAFTAEELHAYSEWAMENESFIKSEPTAAAMMRVALVLAKAKDGVEADRIAGETMGPGEDVTLCVVAAIAADLGLDNIQIASMLWRSLRKIVTEIQQEDEAAKGIRTAHE